MVLKRHSTSDSLTDAECRTLAPAVANRLATSLVGRARALWELSTGANPIQGDEGGTRLNPQGLRGVDRSGAPWGDALLHPLWVMESDGAFSSTVYGRQTPWVTLSAQGQIERRIITLEVRPFEERPLTPYSRGIFTCKGSRVGGSGTATVVITCYGPDLENGPAPTGALSSTSATSLSDSSGDPWVPLRPGINTVVVDFELTSSIGAVIHTASLNQTARRTH
jgi:hypothetical protein